MDIIFDYVMMTWKWLMQHSLLINSILAFVIVFLERRDPKAVWAWLLLLYSIPVAGFVLYLILGQNMHKRNIFRVKEVEDAINIATKKQENRIINHEFKISEDGFSEYQEQVLFNLEYSNSIYSENNSIRIFTTGKEKFGAVLEEIRKAKKYIHIQYYILSDGELLDKLVDELVKKARQGVEVRILYASMGARHFGHWNNRKLKLAGVKLGEFFPAYLGCFQFRINYRNHRKIVVIDGKKAFLGGFNVADEYIGKVKKFGNWRDTHMLFEGEVVNDIHLRFMQDWNYTTKEALFMDEKYFEFNQPKKKNKIGMQIVSSGPDSKDQEIRDNYLKMITKAKERIYIQTPYFIPDEPVMTSLKIAAASGIDVRVMIPCKPDHPFVYWATYSYAGDLIKAGGRGYCYDEGFLHAKGMIVDGIVCSYGTANMDVRSFSLNFEINAIIYDTDTACQFERIFLNDMTKSTEITRLDYDRRNIIIRIKEQISRLLMPIL